MAKLKKMRTKGGARPGAGRPRGPETVPLSVRVLPETKSEIQRRASLASVSYGGYIDHAIELAGRPHGAVDRRLKKG